MNFSCDKETLLKSIEIVSKAIAPNNPIDILRGMKIEVGENIKLTGGDGNFSIESVFDANIEEGGTLIVDSRIFYDIIRNIPNGKVKLFTSDNNEIKIICENTMFNILYLSSEGYPSFNKVTDGENIRIYSKNLKETIKNTLFAVSDDESRPILTGVCFEINKSNMKAIAIDKTRLALRNQIIPETSLSNYSFVVPEKVLSDVSKILKDDATIVDIFVNKKSVMFKYDNFTIVSNLLEGDFIDYNRLIPKDPLINAKINIKSFREMIERASIIINYDDPNIPLVLKIKDSEITVECVSKFGNFCEKIYVDKFGEDLVIGVNSRLILNALKCIEDEYANFEFTNMRGPFVIKPLEGESYIYMVLPMELKNRG